MTGEDPSKVYVADLKQATATPGSPAGTWTAPSQIQTLTESHLAFGPNGIAVVQGTGIGIVTGEFGAIDPAFNQQDRGDWITAIALADGALKAMAATKIKMATAKTIKISQTE